tara:strand:+ start:5125 stop:5478 length:354 start_codon:yes stop_codon:yes gene_type:complete
MSEDNTDTKVIKEKDAVVNPTLASTVDTDTELKKWLVNYVGSQQEPNDGDVTVEMIVETVAEEFPEFLMVIAEENWIRGYYQAMIDVEEGTKAIREQVARREQQKAEQAENAEREQE